MERWKRNENEEEINIDQIYGENNGEKSIYWKEEIKSKKSKKLK